MDPYLTDKNGYKYTQGAGGTRIYVDGPYAGKEAFVDPFGNFYLKVSFVGSQPN